MRHFENVIKFSFILIIIGLIVLFTTDLGLAKVTGECVNCHTMHNSQDGSTMAYDTLTTTPNPALTRGNCLGCHGQGGGNHITTTDIPQVLHSGATDLAGGNFGYIAINSGNVTINTGTTSSVGHNVIDLGVAEGTLTAPPGDEHSTGITNANFTCAGVNGCHGDRTKPDNYSAISGGHHSGVSGLCDTADTTANSYRFLKGVKGYENMDATGPDYRWQNVNSQYHNEYYGSATPAVSSATDPAGNTMSGFCAECHGNFHGEGEIGGSTSSPFTRHPSDVVLPNKTEYAAYTIYSVEAPIARATLPGAINTNTVNDVVTPGSDIVMCLSCHGAHATANEDILRWDYTTMSAGNGSTGNVGCFTCHTTKDN